MKRVILHVVESFGGGVANAVCAYARATPHLEHHLLRRIRGGEYLPSDGDSDLFRSITSMSESNLMSIRDVRRRVRDLRPDVVHAHSSIAGMISRLAVKSSKRLTVCYTPHCYAFERQDLSIPIRMGIATVERLLSVNTTVVGACSPREMDLARKLRKSQRTVYLPNVPRSTLPDDSPNLRPHHGRLKIVTMGRVSAQKDPTFFAAVSDHLSSLPVDFELQWIGDGDDGVVSVLKQRGVDVSGWLSHEDAVKRLRQNDLYMHTAAWEAMPLVLLEAHAMGLPIVARKVPSMPWLNSVQAAETPEQVADLAIAIATDPKVREENLAAWANSFEHNSTESQRDALTACYSGK